MCRVQHETPHHPCRARLELHPLIRGPARTGTHTHTVTPHIQDYPLDRLKIINFEEEKKGPSHFLTLFFFRILFSFPVCPSCRCCSVFKLSLFGVCRSVTLGQSNSHSLTFSFLLLCFLSLLLESFFGFRQP